jgi:ABC-type Na+ transport system ATPase subunit NatA
MTKLITNQERIHKAKDLLLQAKEIPFDPKAVFMDIGYVAKVKDLLRQAKDLVKFIPFSPSADSETKQTTKEIFKQIEETEKDLLHRA